MNPKDKALNNKKEPERKMLFVGKVEHKDGHYFSKGNRSKTSAAKYMNESDRKYGVSGSGDSHAKAIGSMLEADHRFRHGRNEIKTRNPKFKLT